MKTENHFPINWTNGVKITKDHFIESYFNIVESSRDYAESRLTDYNFGLLDSHSIPALKINTDIIGAERISISLNSCNLITAKGCRIVYSKDIYSGETPSASLESKDIDRNSILNFHVIISIEPFNLVPVGEPDPEAIPLHHPFALPKIKISIVSESMFNTNFAEKYFLQAGKIQWKNGTFLLDKEYIPPVARIKYNTQIASFYKSIYEKLTNIKSYAIIINEKNRDRLQNNKLASNTFLLSTKVLDFISQNIFDFNEVALEQSPIFIPQRMSILANYLHNEITTIKETEKEDLLQYYYEWISIKPSDFERALGNVMALKYNHLEINGMIDEIDYFMAIINKLWKKLSELEYIGQRKDNIVISEDNLSIKDERKDNSWSIID